MTTPGGCTILEVTSRSRCGQSRTGKVIHRQERCLVEARETLQGDRSLLPGTNPA